MPEKGVKIRDFDKGVYELFFPGSREVSAHPVKPP